MVGDRVVPRVIDVTAPGSRGRRAGVALMITVTDGVARCSHLDLTMRDGRRGVRSEDLRHVRLDDWIELIVAATSAKVESSDESGLVAYVGDSTDFVREARQAVRAMQRSGRRKIDRLLLERVAAVYRDHEDDAPVRAVEDAFGTSYRTAARWVQTAREQGLL